MIIACQRGPGGHCTVLCCRCGRNEARHTSPSGKSAYCDERCVSRCGKHTIEDFEYDESIGRWVDPCVIGRSTKKQQELWETVK